MELESYYGFLFSWWSTPNPAPLSEYGLTLYWSGDGGVGLTGLTELVQQERCEDPWYLTMLDECRAGQLSEDNCNFLHGRRTSVPGSWMAVITNPHTMCGMDACTELAYRKAIPDDILEHECSVCKTERSRRARVATTGKRPTLPGQNEQRSPDRSEQ